MPLQCIKLLNNLRNLRIFCNEYAQVFWGGIMEAVKEQKSQELKLINREKLSINEVLEVVKFDDSIVVLITKLGELTIEGNNIKISTLDTDMGFVSLDGKIDSIYYTNDAKNESKGFFAKLFS